MRPLPLVGITAAADPRMPGHFLLRWDYVRGVELSGGIPVILAPWTDVPPSLLLDRIDGLVLSGGQDIHPAMYGKVDSAMNTPIPPRDTFEFALTREALERDMPILGICRGMQLLNVLCGGDLWNDIPTEVGAEIPHDDPERPRDRIAHDVMVLPGSRLYSITRKKRFGVNSFHHQGVKRLGKGLEVAAVADDQVVEGVELPSSSFVLGIQWHPESLCDKGGPFLSLFQAVTQEAASKL